MQNPLSGKYLQRIIYAATEFGCRFAALISKHEFFYSSSKWSVLDSLGRSVILRHAAPLKLWRIIKIAAIRASDINVRI